jgi:hypothetical protein
MGSIPIPCRQLKRSARARIEMTDGGAVVELDVLLGKVRVLVVLIASNVPWRIFQTLRSRPRVVSSKFAYVGVF